MCNIGNCSGCSICLSIQYCFLKNLSRFSPPPHTRCSLYAPWTTRSEPVCCSSSAVHAKCPSEDSPSSWVNSPLFIPEETQPENNTRFAFFFSAASVPCGGVRFRYGVNHCELPSRVFFCLFAVFCPKKETHCSTTRHLSIHIIDLWKNGSLSVWGNFPARWSLLFNRPLYIYSFLLVILSCQGAMDLSVSASRKSARRLGCLVRIRALTGSTCRPTRATSSSSRR